MNKNSMHSDWINKETIMYGFGCVGKGIFPKLKYLNPNFLGVAVTSIENNQNNIPGMSIPIKPINHWLDKNDALILISTNPKLHKEITNTCTSLGFNNIIPATNDFIDCLTFACYKKWFLSHQIDISKKIISIGNGNYLNPFTSDVPHKSALLDQIGDYIIPMQYNDYCFVKEGTYEVENVHLQKGDVVLDIGANMGSFSVYAASKGCKSYAFEPTPYLGNVIKEHSALNEYKIEHIPYAVSDNTGETLFYSDPTVGIGNSMFENNINTMEQFKVKTITIDEFVKENKINKVSFIKADIEGAERLMLAGAVKTLKEHMPKLSLCTYHLPDDKEVLTELILKANPNYKIKYKWDKMYAWIE